jgi:hypothetical protein
MAAPPAAFLRRILIPLFALLLALLATALCRAAGNVTLGLFFGPVAFTTLIVPPLVCAESSQVRRLLVAGAATAGVSLVWLGAIGERLTLAQWSACSVALLGYAVALAGVCSLLLAIRFNAVLAAALVTTLGLLWLTWPVWLSHALTGPHGDTLVAWLVPAHPFFGINSTLIHFDTWDRHPLAYTRLTVLNQDVFYQLPKGTLRTTAWHLIVGATAFTAGWLVERRRRRRVHAP